MIQSPFGLGAVRRPKDKRDFRLGDYQAPVAIPATFIQNVSAIPVKMQGTFGTCGGHAGAFLDSKLQTDKRGSVQDLSPKFLWKEIKLIDNLPLTSGTDMRSIFQTLATVGDCSEATLPNVLDTTIEQYSDPSVITAAMKDEGAQNELSFAYAFEDTPTLDQIKQAIYQNKAVLAAVSCGTGWWTPSWKASDILPLKLGTAVDGHFIVLHSYDEQYIYFRNSWSTAWGNNGDGYFDASYIPNIWEIGTTLTLPASFLFTENLWLGQKNNDVLQLQKRLSVTPQTGFFGPLTFKAVVAYQSAHNITPTGFVGPITRASLNTTL